MIKSENNSEFYNWGNKCSGWHLVKGQNLSVIKEIMPPETKEQKHFHKFAKQFFYILNGTAKFDIDGLDFIVTAGAGIVIEAFAKHQIKNNTKENLEFIVISQPTSKNDRINEPFIEEQKLNLNDKKFKVIENSENGEISSETIFHYRQKDDITWATYEGGDIKFGTLSGRINEEKLEFTYQHQNIEGEFLTGKCRSTIKLLDNGKIRLHEKWQWTSKDFSSGTSVLEEL